MGVICSDCGDEFASFRGMRIHQGRGCKNTKICARCGDEFPVPPSREDQRRQCSDCWQEHGWHSETARLQSKNHQGPPPEVIRRGENHPNWSGGYTQYPNEFNSALKEQVRRKDQYRCQDCMLPQYLHSQQLDVHHIDEDKMNNKIDNLITLCRSCHTMRHLKGG